MLAKTVAQNGRDWDTRLPYVLFAYRSSIQESAKESPFFLLYGRDPCLPTEETLSMSTSHQLLDLDDYKTELVTGLAEAWQLAQTNVRKAQQKQKKQHDRRAKGHEFRLGDQVFVYMPAAKRAKAYKFAKPFAGPYRIVDVYNNGAEVQLISRPQSESIRVAFNHIRRCPNEIPGSDGTAKPASTGMPGGPTLDTEVEATSTVKPQSRAPPQLEKNDTEQNRREVPGAWRDRLRPRKSNPSEDAGPKDGEM